MNGLILALVLSQATVEVRISVQVVKPTCVVIDAAGEAKVVPKRSVRPGDRATACTTAPASAPRVEQRVEVAATAETPELRVVDVIY